MIETPDELPFGQSVSEADIDWILCIELDVNPGFRACLSGRIFGFDPLHIRTWRSVADPWLGESDLLWLVSAPDGTRQIALIENKISAQAQPLQYERYVRHADQYKAQGHCVAYRIALISPQAYRSTDSSDYEISISYESIKDWSARNGTERGRYLSSVFERLFPRLPHCPRALRSLPFATKCGS